MSASITRHIFCLKLFYINLAKMRKITMKTLEKWRVDIMNKEELQQCITECESALTHLNKALNMAHSHSKEKMQHAAKDLEACIAECRELL